MRFVCRFADPFLLIVYVFAFCNADDFLGCGGFVQSEVPIDYTLIEVKLYTKEMNLKYSTDCAPTNGYYMIPVYDKGDYILTVGGLGQGFSFEPNSVDLHIDGTTDKCSKGEDINFRFTGFAIKGQVVSKGQAMGPEGVTLKLKDEKTGKVKQETTSVKDGMYVFEGLMPGPYEVQASHPVWTFAKASTHVTIKKMDGHGGNSITVFGYDVHGKVLSEGEPIKGVNFMLFSDNVKPQEVINCDKTPVKGFKSGEQRDVICHVASQQDGTFVFPSLPCGAYSLMPFYKGEHITFDVVPGKLDFVVNHDSLTLEKTFTVAGFSVSGQVLDAANGKGVGSAKIVVNGKEQGLTRQDGTYHLENMKTGTYSIQVMADKYFFDAADIKVTPNTPKLPAIIAARFSVCGRVVIEKVPEGLSQVAKERKIVVHPADKPDKLTTLLTDTTGRFCGQLASGSYVVKAVITPDEDKAGLKLAPLHKAITVANTPIADIIFSQFRAKVSGTVTCLEPCSNIQVALAAVGRSDDRQITKVKQVPNGATFLFHDVMPGRFIVEILQDKWCWKQKKLEVEVLDQDISNLDFIQDGYILQCSLSHLITLNFAHESTPGNVGSFNVSKGINKFCLKQPGVYRLTPVSCHQFEKEEYRYDTSQGSMLTLTAIKHLAEGTIVTQERVNDITVTVKSSVEGDAVQTLGPLKSDKEPVAPPPPEKAAKEGEKKEAVVQKEPEGPFTYTFSYWARTGEKLDMAPSSKELLFYPDSMQVTVQGESCPGQVATFEGRRGVFIEGQVSPSLAGVALTISGSDGTTKIDTQTGEDGRYRVGPLHSTVEYSVSAEKTGYIMTQVEGKPGHFKAFKLGEIKVKVDDQANQLMGGVLLSLSGGAAFRSNKLTLEDGTMSFPNLSPGQYFLKPMMKEYDFVPQSKVIEVLEGTTVDLKISARRWQFSCYGRVSSLNGEPEQGVVVEAVGMGSCAQSHEDTKTEPDGSYRIRGLEPICKYEVKLKTGEINQHIERGEPNHRVVSVKEGDVFGINMIAFRRMNQMDLSGNIIGPEEHLPTLKVQLFKEDNVDSPVHTINMGVTSFFYLPSVVKDNTNYLLRVRSTLSRSSYEYSLPEASFTANTSFRHFTFSFNPKPRPSDQDMAHGSLWILPLAALIAIVAYQHQTILPLLLQTAKSAQTTLTSRPMAGPSPSLMANIDIADSATKKKIKVRKT